MKPKIIIVILVVACVALAIALFATKQQGEKQHETDISSIGDYSNQVITVNKQVSDLSQVNLMLTNDLAMSHQQAAELSNNLINAAAMLASVKSKLATEQDRVITLTNQISGLNSQIADLEVQNKALDDRANDLTNTIAQLNAKIEETQNLLAISETNRTFIQAELQKQLAEKAELEHKFNDLNEVRAQVKKLKDELFVQRRMQLDKSGNGMKKGGQVLMERTPPKSPAPNYDLNVEVGSDGSVKVIPPIGGKTNSTAH